LAVPRNRNELDRAFFAGVSLDSTAHFDRSSASARLRRGAGIMIAVFWTFHFVTMMLRAELNDLAGDRELNLDGVVRRIVFAMFGALLSYIVYRCLKPLRLREFGRQAMIGAALALAAALVQATLNTFMFSGSSHRLSNFIFLTLYWFWFYFSSTSAYLAFSYSITVQEQERHAAELTVKAQEAQVRALRYQINPHFLFNTLNAIAALVRDSPAKAEEMVVRLSDFFRRSLAVNPMEDVTLLEEVDIQRLYLEIERTRFPDRLRFDVALDAGSAEARVPALLLQPLVENAVKHGVARSEGPICVRIRARLDGPVLEIVVENDAVAGGADSGGEKVGLRNVAERLRSRFGDEASLTAGEIAEGGFRNMLRIPLRR
jgi:two-component system, LytTR family, sensor kinase